MIISKPKFKSMLTSHLDVFETPDDERLAESLFLPQALSLEESEQHLIEMMDAGTPFNMMRLGDSEANFLRLKHFDDPVSNDILKSLIILGGFTREYPEYADELTEAILASDMVCCMCPPVAQNYHWSWAFDGLFRSDLLDKREYADMHTIYRLAQSGRLFQYLWGKRVVVVGAKSRIFQSYFFHHPHYRQAFPFLGLEHIELVEVIETPDIDRGILESRQRIEKAVQESFKLKPDVFVLSFGFLAKPLSVYLRNEGYTAIDFGALLDCMMNFKKRAFLDVFARYEHPEYDFQFDEARRVLGILPKKQNHTS